MPSLIESLESRLLFSRIGLHPILDQDRAAIHADREQIHLDRALIRATARLDVRTMSGQINEIKKLIKADHATLRHDKRHMPENVPADLIKLANDQGRLRDAFQELATKIADDRGVGLATLEADQATLDADIHKYRLDKRTG